PSLVAQVLGGASRLFEPLIGRRQRGMETCRGILLTGGVGIQLWDAGHLRERLYSEDIPAQIGPEADIVRLGVKGWEENGRALRHAYGAHYRAEHVPVR